MYAVWAISVFAMGVASRTIEFDSVLIDKYLGDALYAVLFYLGLGVLFPAQSVVKRVLYTVIFVVTVECFQITGIPLEWRQRGNFFLKLASIVLGTVFSWYDMLAYFVGIALVGWIDFKSGRGFQSINLENDASADTP